MEKELSSKESLALITQMISKAKREAAGDGSFQLLLWGWVVAICNFGHYTLEKIGYEAPYIVWLLIIPATGVSIWDSIRKRNRARVKTHLDEMLSGIWISVFVGMLITLSFMPTLSYQQNPIILILAGIGVISTGVLVRVNVIRNCGILLMAGAVIAFLLPVTDQYLIAGIAMILGYLVPGYYLKTTYRERV
jgi:Flp pilus assembly protein TadB